MAQSKNTKKNKKNNFLKRFTASNKLNPFVFIIAFAIIGLLAFQLIGAAPKNKVNGVSLQLNPTSKNVKVGEEFSVQINVDTAGKAINAVQSNLAYDKNSIEYISADTASGAFEFTAQAEGGNGSVKVAVGNVTPLTGKQLVATVKFKGIKSANKTAIQFTADSQVAEASTSDNVLVSRVNGTYKVR